MDSFGYAIQVLLLAGYIYSALHHQTLLYSRLVRYTGVAIFPSLPQINPIILDFVVSIEIASRLSFVQESLYRFSKDFRKQIE